MIADDAWARPFPSRTDSVWMVAPGSDTDNPRFTGIFHSDVDCPVLTTWVTSEPSHAQLLEIDRASGDALAEWECDWISPDGWREFPGRQRFALDTFRPCMRCGQLSPPPARAVCSTCWLTPCCCD